MKKEPFQIKVFAEKLPFDNYALSGHLVRRLNVITLKTINKEEQSFTLETQMGMEGIAMNLERLYNYFDHRSCKIIKMEITEVKA